MSLTFAVVSSLVVGRQVVVVAVDGLVGGGGKLLLFCFVNRKSISSFSFTDW